jgi:Protein of unknown function (DUF805)
MARIVETVFGVSRRVDRGTYAITGVSLMAVKYGVEAAVFWLFTTTLFSPLDFVNPLLTSRESILRPAPPWLAWALCVWTLPFLWVAVSMSIRRAADAGVSPWVGFVVLIPIVNLLMMVVLALLPSEPGDHWTVRDARPEAQGGRVQAAISVAYSLMIGGVMMLASIYAMSTYGASLFLGTPVLMGASAAYFFNRSSPHTFVASAALGAASVLLGCTGMLLFALEGVICLMMAIPMAVPLAALGGLLGKAIADASRRPVHELAAALVMLPLWAVGEAWLARAPERVVLTAVEIAAPPSVVWENVIAFPELPAQRAWYFSAGIACPERAWIDGQGVGAIRHCEFTTGAFVEPITAWEEPRRLAFDVTEQPAPMFELSPYHNIHPPHLDGFLRSTRGEFRLIALQDGSTRLEGRTWYRSAMFPQWYWSAWSDLIIHRIHERVLVHIGRLSEATVVAHPLNARSSKKIDVGGVNKLGAIDAQLRHKPVGDFDSRLSGLRFIENHFELEKVPEVFDLVEMNARAADKEQGAALADAADLAVGER